MTYRCPSDGVPLVTPPETVDTQRDGTRLYCPACFTFWRPSGNGRLRKAQRGLTDGQLREERERLLES
jgi:hypothetical protein